MRDLGVLRDPAFRTVWSMTAAPAGEGSKGRLLTTQVSPLTSSRPNRNSRVFGSDLSLSEGRSARETPPAVGSAGFGRNLGGTWLGSLASPPTSKHSNWSPWPA